MHRFPSKSIIIRFKFTAILLCLGCLMVPAVAGTLSYSIMTDDPGLTKIGIALLVLTVLVAILQCMLASRTRCPLCMTPVLASKRCSKHRNARTFLGSHRLRVAFAILFKNAFKCPYCNEVAAMEVRNRGNANESGRY